MSTSGLSRLVSATWARDVASRVVRVGRIIRCGDYLTLLYINISAAGTCTSLFSWFGNYGKIQLSLQVATLQSTDHGRSILIRVAFPRHLPFSLDISATSLVLFLLSPTFLPYLRSKLEVQHVKRHSCRLT
jgi:hypothetical protein